jgi:cell division protein FtsB
MTSDERPAALKAEQQRRRARQVRLALVFLACALLLEALVGDRGLSRTLQAGQELERAAQSLTALTRENARLRGEVHRLQQDPDTLERVARQELGLVRPGEILVVLKDAR